MSSTSASGGNTAVKQVADAVRAALPASLDLRLRPTLVVGVSGGLDSMVLAHVLVSLGARVCVVHVNYGLRDEALADQQLVQTWCAANDCPCDVHQADPMQAGQSLQAVARSQRYAAFLAAATSHAARWVSVGHHADDQAETVLLSAMRKAGPEGLAGMAPVRPLTPDGRVLLWRPLLQNTRRELQRYAKAVRLAWRQDASNDERTYRRNRLRHDVLPALEHIQTGSARNIAASARLLRAYVDEHIKPQLHALWQRVLLKNDGIWIPDDLFAELPDVWRGRLVLEALRRGLDGCPGRQSQVEAVLSLRQRQVGRRVQFPGGTVWRCRKGLFVERASYAPTPVPPTVLQREGRMVHDGYVLTWCRVPAAEAELGKVHTQYLDAERAGDALHLRAWQTGDTIRPLGMAGTKLVSDVLTDARLPPHKKPYVPVVCDAQGSVLAVLGVCTAEPARITAATHWAWQLTYMRQSEESGEIS
ncbi:MAG: tRNA lysidine(34) synthetase TilS [Bacteroidota bacterium]